MEKSLINANSDVNQLLPIKYTWAREHYRNGTANFWIPQEVPMAKDIEQWKRGKLTEDERLMVIHNLGFFSTAESLVGNNLVLAIFKFISNAECRQYLLLQAREEATHSETFLYICESLDLDPDEIYQAYQKIPSIKAKDDFALSHTKTIFEPNFETKTEEGKREFLKNLVMFYVIMEGVWFYSGFAMILSLKNRNLMPGIAEQYTYILRDESTHLNFGIDLINGIKAENPKTWSKSFKDEMTCLIDEAVTLEIAYAQDCLPGKIEGLDPTMFDTYTRYIANRRLERIGLRKLYKDAKSPFPWMSEVIDLPKEKNFFESRVTEYKQGGLSWE